jgi:hypothetical protein
MLKCLPEAWEKHIRLGFRKEIEMIESLQCASAEASADCTKEARALIGALEQRFGHQLRLVFGTNTMTVNRQPRGKLLRLHKKLNEIYELDPAVSDELAGLLHLSKPSYKIDETQAFCEADITAVGRALSQPAEGSFSGGEGAQSSDECQGQPPPLSDALAPQRGSFPVANAAGPRTRCGWSGKAARLD